jgi:hypothetical protein
VILTAWLESSDLFEDLESIFYMRTPSSTDIIEIIEEVPMSYQGLCGMILKKKNINTDKKISQFKENYNVL